MCPNVASKTQPVKDVTDKTENVVLGQVSNKLINNSRGSNHVFMQTPRIQVQGANGNHFVRGHHLIDTGSQRSYILQCTAIS